ncbi:cupin domain-containing protein [Purpureocillium lilacinum]|uniref:Cupin domain-containing protein n=1 Tax=Purpureocillium lilacinum TaxID=33203 RepID=A0A179GJM4_PURLI|nr:cupin domain-containing protein [Purpureocillium lilacinum]
MASLLPLISELLPMILPAETHITRAEQLTPRHPTVEGPVTSRPAVVGRCDKMCASVVTTRPKSCSPVKHNSEQDAIIYAVSGTGVLVVNEGGFGSGDTGEDIKDGDSADEEGADGNHLRRHALRPGDFAFVPAWTEHQVRNEEGDEDVVWVVIQGGSRPVGATLTGWGGDEVFAED